MTAQKLIETEIHGRVGVIALNRPSALNALSRGLAEDLAAAAEAFESDDSIGAIVVTGRGRAFAAGADIAEMAPMDYKTISGKRWFYGPWEKLAELKKPVIAAVNGFALGGGCELALQCDMIIASEKAKFGQPEINLGVIPGIGGSQRLARFIGKAMTMDLCLTGRMIDAQEALRIGLVSRVLPAETFLEDAIKIAAEIASKSPIALEAMTEAIDAAFEMSLSNAVRNERDIFYALFKTEDQKEGMKAFLEKRPAKWTGR